MCFFFSSRRRHTRFDCDWSSDVCSSDLIWGATLWLSGYVSAASLAAATLFPLWVRLTEPDAPYTFWASVVLALLIAYSHRGNIRRLIDGTENRFRTRKGVVA